MRVLLILLFTIVATSAQAEKQKKIVSVGGALTEIIYALDAEDMLVGSDTTSYFPADAEKLPKVGYQRALSAEGILSLNPDLVILTDEAGPPPVLKQLETAGVKLLKIDAGRSVEDVKNSIKTIAKELDKTQEANNLIEKIDEQIVVLNEAINSQKEQNKVMFILQHGGGAPMVAGMGTAADSIIKLSGAANAVTEYEGYKPLTPESAVAMQPDFILITNQGFEQAGGKEGLLRLSGISLTKAAAEGNVIVMDSQLLLGFGPRTVDAALQLNEKYK